MILHTFSNVFPATIEKRPSATCKTPYVADIVIQHHKFLGHSPSLGCCGLADKDSNVLCSKIESKSKKTCQFKIELAVFEEKDAKIIIGINPKLAESIAETALKNNCILHLENIQSYQRESTFLNSRFDFSGIDQNGKQFIMEIKNVPLADYVDCSKKERKKYEHTFDSLDINDKIAYFPDGYRKNKNAVVSPRALKHIQELQTIATTTDIRTILLFVIQRSDVKHFQPSNIDLTYKETVKNAYLNGVEIKTLQVSWDYYGNCTFIKNNLPIHLSDDLII